MLGWLWVGLRVGLGWVGLGWVGLGRVCFGMVWPDLRGALLVGEHLLAEVLPLVDAVEHLRRP